MTIKGCSHLSIDSFEFIRDLSSAEDAFSELNWREDPVADIWDFLKPSIVHQARRVTIDRVKPLLFSNDLEIFVVEEFPDATFIECKVGLTAHPCEIEDVLRHELAHLVEDGDEILITSRDLFVCLQTAFLQDTVKDSRSVERFARAMEKTEQGEDIDIDLAVLLLLGRIPELIRV